MEVLNPWLWTAAVTEDFSPSGLCFSSSSSSSQCSWWAAPPGLRHHCLIRWSPPVTTNNNHTQTRHICKDLLFQTWPSSRSELLEEESRGESWVKAWVLPRRCGIVVRPGAFVSLWPADGSNAVIWLHTHKRVCRGCVRCRTLPRSNTEVWWQIERAASQDWSWLRPVSPSLWGGSIHPSVRLLPCPSYSEAAVTNYPEPVFWAQSGLHLLMPPGLVRNLIFRTRYLFVFVYQSIYTVYVSPKGHRNYRPRADDSQLRPRGRREMSVFIEWTGI